MCGLEMLGLDNVIPKIRFFAFPAITHPDQKYPVVIRRFASVTSNHSRQRLGVGKITLTVHPLQIDKGGK
jgi:hypothetical protein